jgi:amino acid transporter
METEPRTIVKRVKRVVFGAARSPTEPGVFHKISLVAFLAWVGLGSDGLSSSAYGPDEAFRTLGEHAYLAVFLALATALTVFIISYAYSRIIEHFPSGGGGYVVATKLLGPGFGVVSGCALLVDYVLTISTSIASSADQIFSFLPLGWHGWKLPLEVLTIAILLVLNIRGVKESVSVLLPIFILFVITHAVVLVWGIGSHIHELPAVSEQVASGVRHGLSTLGFGALFFLFAKAYSRGAGTYTGIEAVSNGIQIMREPKVHTAKKTMAYMATSLAVTAGGILLCYLLLGVRAEEGKTMNAVMVERLGFGTWFVALTLVAEGALLIVAAQTGFIDGPRVMSNMALDSWFPRRFDSLSERLTMHYGVSLMAIASIATLIYTKGNISALITMYSINVFVTFSLSQMGMCRFWITERHKHARWKRTLLIHAIGLTLCLSILTIVIKEKFMEGGWMTLLVTSLLIGLCWLIKRHYKRTRQMLKRLDALLTEAAAILPTKAGVAAEPPKLTAAPGEKTAVILVNGFGGLGLHALFTVLRIFRGHFKNFVFIQVGLIDAGQFKGAEEIKHLEETVTSDLDRYVNLMHANGFYATSFHSLGTDVAEEVEKLAVQVAEHFPNSVLFASQLVFPRETIFTRVLHNYTAFAIQKRLYQRGMPLLILPIRVET